ncbi:MAG: hypothetical protein M1817_003892 [Caeruleum heppii]|nr:MAG: hypothetical protein M1817_003892 [Caeruleum heppii]
MEDPNLIATLIPSDDIGAAKFAFKHPQNRPRYLAPTRLIPECPTISSREATPAQDHPGVGAGEGGGEYNSSHRILLRFKDGIHLKSPTNGITFGSNVDKCDVFLGPRGTGGYSGMHFCITFDDAGNVYLKDSSTWGTVVSYSGQANEQIRRHFTWRLSHPKKAGKWDVRVGVPDSNGLGFKIELATHKTCEDEYVHNVHQFLADGRNAAPPINALGIDSHETTAPPSRCRSPKQRPIYLRDDELGRGAFGSVYKIIDASTGFVFAGKYFHRPNSRGAGWLEDIRREIRIMTSVRHDHLVHALDSMEDPEPLLVMPYFESGNLEDAVGITVVETISLLYQSLQALVYLHYYRIDRKRIAHRDIKPANILIVSRVPFCVKLADFGLAQDRSDLVTHCGTLAYVASKVLANKEAYTTAVDIWSLGVVVLQYAFGLPEEEGDS